MPTTIFNENSILFAVFIGMIVYGVRRLVEGRWPAVKTSPLWGDLALYFFPIVLGSLGAWALSVAGSSLLPQNLTRADQILWGSVAGGFSGFAYTVAKKRIRQASKSTSSES